MLEITTDESGLLPSDDGQFIEGSPNIPAKLIEVGIPTGSDFEISVLEAEYETVNNVDIAPIIPLQNTEKPEKPIKLSEIYKQNEFYPNSWTNSKKIVRIRNQRIARFYISIIQYNPSTHQIKRLKRIKLKLKFNRNKSNNKIFYDAHFEKFYKSRLIN
jgi:hypothetical protein